MQSADTKTSPQPISNTESLHHPLVGSSYEPTVSEVTSFVKPSLGPQIHLFKSQVILNPTISKINFFAFLLYSAYLALIVLPAALLALPLLKIVYNISESSAIDAVTITQVCTLAYKFFAYPLIGALCDKYGRKPFIIVGIILMNAGIFLMPNLPDIYPFYIFASILQDFGLLCLTIPPLLADYIDYETKGRVAGIAGVLGSLMSFVSTFVTAEINVQDNIPSEYHYIGIGGFGLGIIIILGLKGGPYHRALFFDQKAEEAKQKAAEMIQEEKRRLSDYNGSAIRNGIGSGHQDFENIPVASQAPQLTTTENAAVTTEDETPGFKVGIREAQRNPWILLGYLGNFLNIGVLILINSTLVNYVPAITGNEDDANQAYNLANKEVLAALISIFFFGYALDKFDKFKILVSTIFLSIVAVIVLLASPSPYGPFAYVSMACFGVSTAGVGTFTGQALSKYPNPKYRASVAAVGGICSMLGQIWISIIGTSLSQFDPRIPFYLHMGGAIVVLCAIFRIYISKRDIMSKL